MPFLKRPGQPDLHCTRYEEAFARNRPEVQKAMADLFHGISAEPYLPKIAAPVLGLHPTDGPITTAGQEAILTSKIKNLRMIHMPSSFHKVQLVFPAACATHRRTSPHSTTARPVTRPDRVRTGSFKKMEITHLMRKLPVLLSALAFAFSGAACAQNAAKAPAAPVPPAAPKAPAAPASAATFTWGLSPQSQCRIKPDPAGCTARAQIILDPCVQRAVAATLTVTVSYAENGRNDSQTTTKGWSGNACQIDLVEDAGGRIVGGNVSMTATVTLGNGVTHSDRKADAYWGNNPAAKDVRALIANPTYAVVAYDRSKFRQFDAGGRPVFNKGFGVMLLAAPDAEQVWHWRRNVAEGKSKLDAAWAGARTYPDRMRKNGHPKLPDFSAKEHRLFALQSLIGELYYMPNTNGSQWIPNPKRSDYADRLARIEDAVAAGKPPADW